MSDYGRSVLRFWRVRPSECAEMVNPFGERMCLEVDQQVHAGLSEQGRREVHDYAAGARWLPWGFRNWLGDHGLDLSRGARAGWADFASSIIRTSIIDRLWRLANRMERPLPPHLDAPQFHYAPSVAEHSNDALWRGYAAGKAAADTRTPGPLTAASGGIVQALRGPT